MLTMPARRGLTVAFVMVANAIVQFDWLTFAPMKDAVAKHYHVTTDQVGLFALCFAIAFLPLGIPAGVFIDRFGVRTTLWVTAALLASGSIVRAIDGFSAALAGQTVIALAQPLIVSVVSPMALTRHPKREHLTTISLCMMAMFAGLALAFIAIPSAFIAVGIAKTLAISAVVHVLLAVTVVVVQSDPARSDLAHVPKFAVHKLLQNRAFLVLVGLLTLGNGYFSGLVTWLEQILSDAGVNAVHAGYAGTAVIVGGVAGAVIIPLAAQRIGDLRTVAPAAVLGLLVLSPVVTQNASALSLTAGYAALGFVLLGIVPVLIDRVSELAGAAHSGLALSIVWTVGNAGAAAVIALLPLAVHANTWRPAIWWLEVILFAEFVLTLFLQEGVTMVGTAE